MDTHESAIEVAMTNELNRPMRKPARSWLLEATLIAGLVAIAHSAAAQSLPQTQGETLSGKRIAPANAIKGHPAVLIAGFSREAGDGCGVWFHDLRSDPALKDVAVFEVAEIERAPSFVRGMIKGGMRKGLSAADQDNFVVLTQDDAAWRSSFQVSNDKDPYVILFDVSGQVRWRGHGQARDLEGQLKAALR